MTERRAEAVAGAARGRRRDDRRVRARPARPRAAPRGRRARRAAERRPLASCGCLRLLARRGLIIAEAREDAFALVADDPTLARAPGAARRGRVRARRGAGRLPGARVSRRDADHLRARPAAAGSQAPPGSGTRPTSDRVREALFSPPRAPATCCRAPGCSTSTPGPARSGSRRPAAGAAAVVLVESGAPGRRGHPPQRRVAGRRAARGQRPRGAGRAGRWPPHRQPQDRFDLVLLDPPYDVTEDALAAVLRALVAGTWLAPRGPGRRRALGALTRAAVAGRARADGGAPLRRDDDVVRRRRRPARGGLTRPTP